MKKYEILKKIGVIINELQDQYEYTEQNQDDINDLELELFVANAHFLTDHIEILRKLNGQPQPPKLLKEEVQPPAQLPEPEVKVEVKPVAERKYFEPVVQPTTVEKPAQPVTNLDFDVVEEKNTYTATAPAYEPVKEEAPAYQPAADELLLDEGTGASVTEETNANEEAWDNREVMEEQVYQQTDIAEPEPVTQEEIEPELIQTAHEPEVITPEPAVYRPETITTHVEPEKHQATLNEILSARLASSTRLSEQMEVQPIKDLKSAITLNDKLLFVRDLFNGYSMAYGEAIEILNRFSRFEEADQFLKLNYYTKNNWEAKQATTDKFYSLLKRRFV